MSDLESFGMKGLEKRMTWKSRKGSREKCTMYENVMVTHQNRLIAERHNRINKRLNSLPHKVAGGTICVAKN